MIQSWPMLILTNRQSAKKMKLQKHKSGTKNKNLQSLKHTYHFKCFQFTFGCTHLSQFRFVFELLHVLYSHALRNTAYFYYFGTIKVQDLRNDISKCFINVSSLNVFLFTQQKDNDKLYLLRSRRLQNLDCVLYVDLV